jgi:ketosteroid isomerase-like protein
MSDQKAIELGISEFVKASNAGDIAKVLARRYLEIWRKEHGRWLVVRTMDNIE